MKNLILALLVASAFAQSPSGQGSTGGQGSIANQASSTPALVIQTASTLPNATQNVGYLQNITATGGTPCTLAFPYNWTITSGTPPTGTTLVTISGSLQVLTTSLGTFNFTITATDCGGQSVPKAFQLTVVAASIPVITTTSPLPPCIAGTNCTDPIVTVGGTGPYTYSQTAGSVPPGCSFPAGGSSDSLVCSPPTTSGTFNFTVKSTDSLSSASVPVAFAVSVSCPAISVSSSSTWPVATKNSAYSFQLLKSGGTGAGTWTLSGQPTGLSINSSTGLVSGTPSVSGSFTPSVTVTDSCLPTGSVGPQTAALTVNNNVPPFALTTTTPLPTCTVGIPCTVPLTASGGTPPYTFTNPSANLPGGLAISGATITGTPTTPGNFTGITLNAHDSGAGSDNGVSPYSMQINSAAASGDDSRYTNATETWTGGTSDGVANLPTLAVYTPLSATPASGPTKTVCASGCDYSTIQAAFTAAACGWIIQIKSTSNGLPSGTQNSYNVSALTAPATSCPSSNWIWVETDQVSGLPPEGSRITPGWIGITSLPGYPAYAQPSTPGIYLPQLISTNRVINCTAGMSHWRFMGLEIATVPGNTVSDLVTCNGADHIIFDRVVSHGGNSPTWHSTDQITRNFNFVNTTYWAVINSYTGEAHTGGAGSSNFFIGGGSCSTEGPAKIVNNFLSAADSISAVGGSGAGSCTLVLQNIELRRNHSFKPKFWKTNDATYFGTSFTVKDHVDWKNEKNSIIEGNIFDTSWGQQSDQPGPLLELGSKNQSSFTTGSASSSGTAITALTKNFPSTMTAATCAVPNQCLFIFNGVGYRTCAQADTTHITLCTAPPTTASAAYTAYAPGLNPNAEVSNTTIRYNLFTHASRCMEFFAALSDGGDIGHYTGNIEVHDNVCDDIDPAHWNLSGGACCAWGMTLYFSNAYPSPNYLNFLDIHHNTLLPYLSGTNGITISNSSVGDGPSLGFGGQSATTGAIANLHIYDNIGTAGMGLSTKGICTGSKTVLNDLVCWDAVSGAQLNSYCFDHNVLATTTATSGTVVGTANIPPYPANSGGTASPGCGFTLTGTALAASYNAIMFTNLNGANGGTYSLQVGSPYHNTASDGTDPGVAWPTLQQYIQGVN